MNILEFHKKLTDNYRKYINSFLNIKDPGLLQFVEKELNNNKLWPEPLVQFNPTFEKGREIKSLVSEGILHNEMEVIFRGYELYKHQEEAILHGVNKEEFIVTSGTGSGKSLTYIATIFNHILREGTSANGKIAAVIVYPMNALINSQTEALRTYERNYLKRKLPVGISYDETDKSLTEQIKELKEITGEQFPIKYAQYTGQESQEIREQLRLNPPHILLTNYMMMELIMTRGSDDVGLRNNLLAGMRYLVFDELHTYRGRQGSDVALLIRRIKAGASNKILCIGTSATMVSSETATISGQKQEVAKTGSIIFGTDISEEQIVNEYLVKSLSTAVEVSPEAVISSIREGIQPEWSYEDFEKCSSAHWLEEYIALEGKENVLVRRKPITITGISKQLAEYCGLPVNECLTHILNLLEVANRLNSGSAKERKFLPYRIHQFISQTGSVYATLGDQNERKVYLDAGLYSEEKDFIFPLLFSRFSGHEYYCVMLNEQQSRMFPREFTDFGSADDEEEITSAGYIFIQHVEDSEVIWDFERDSTYLPEAWFNPARRDGTRSLKAEKRERIPRKIWFDESGTYSFTDKLEFEGWFIKAPLMFDPTSGIIFDQEREWAKLTKLGGEGRSTATTVLSFETVKLMHAMGLPFGEQKLLSFTDNRQDASLQAGHFNDFVKVGQLRSAIRKALESDDHLDYTNIADRVFEKMEIPQVNFALQPAAFPGPKRENEETFKELIMYRLLHDLRKSWRVVLPNLEQCALLDIDYKYVDESVTDNSLWNGNTLLDKMTPEERKVFLFQVFIFFRKSYALSFSMLDASVINQNVKKIREKLKAPWTLDNFDNIDLPNHIMVENPGRRNVNLFGVSAGYQSHFARYLKGVASSHNITLTDRETYNQAVYQLFTFLKRAGWLVSKPVNTDDGRQISVYQIKVENIVWKKGDGNSIIPDLVRTRSYRTVNPRPNEYFKQFYLTDFHAIKQVEGREHTGQIKTASRQEREKAFRIGTISALFCSPTMELGIDISDLTVVHMRNVPPSPANYAQRSGRAGRSGQAAMVITYCSNMNAHDRHFFKNPSEMVAGSVTAPRMDLINEELLKSHLHAIILTKKSISKLSKSLGDIIDKEDLEHLPIKSEVVEALKLSDFLKQEIIEGFKKVLGDPWFVAEMLKRQPTWFSNEWIDREVNNYSSDFNKSLDRWRILYRNSILQFRAANEIIENRIYAENHDKIKEAKNSRKQAERQMELLLNDTKDAEGRRSNNELEFNPYRYLAAEGFLPGYDFTRLPIRSFLEMRDGSGEFLERPRVVALSEFGPRNIIYHDGAKFRIDRMVLSEAAAKIENARISPFTGYILMKDQYTNQVDPIVKRELNEGMDNFIHTDLIEMGETKAFEMQRITCQEEERSRKGFDTRTYFYIEGGFENVRESVVNINGDKLLHIHAFPAARLVQINLKWKNSPENGFAFNLKTGYWQNRTEEVNAGAADEIRRVKLFTTITANAIYIQPVKSLALKGGSNGVVTLMYALKRAIENYFQVESNEIGATVMGEPDMPNILLYEASEGSLGVLEQMVDSPEIYKEVMKEAYHFCFVKDGVEIPEEELVPATYDDLLTYYNQYHHQIIDRNLIREALSLLKDSDIEVVSQTFSGTYEEQYLALQKARDPNSSTEDKFLKYLHDHGLRLPDKAQPIVQDMYVRPDFFYEPNIFVFCDGTPHDDKHVMEDDKLKREALKSDGKQVHSWYYKEPLEDFVSKRSYIFKPVK